MSNEEDLDDLLAKMERRADQLQRSGTRTVKDTDNFGQTPSALAKSRLGLPKPGDAIGENYEVVRVIGQGDVSTVLLVRHRGVDRLFAMKLLPQALANDAAHVGRFKEEARAASMIGHENIVFVTDFGKSNRFGFFYVMEHLNGDSLAARLAAGKPLQMDVAVNVAVCAGSALAAVHELGIVHRDVRPENLMSHRPDGNEEQTWKLLDFGLSTKVVQGAEALGLQAEPLYTAPELALGTDDIDARADQFSLAAVLYHMLVGRPPWPGRTWTTATPERWTPPAIDPQKAPDVSPFMQQVLFRALSADPGDRFEDVENFVASFQKTSGRSRRPTIPPIDFEEAARAAAGQNASASVIIGTTFESEVSEVSIDEHVEMDDPPSIEISLGTLPNTKTKLTMTFQHAARLRREWRRNLVSGSIFVPTETRIAPGTSVVFALHYAPSGAEATFPARVMEQAEPGVQNPGGVAVEVDAEVRDRLYDFLYELNLGLLDASSIVKPLRKLTEDADLTSDEAFLLSRLPEPIGVGKLRGMFASLPLDLDEIVGQLHDKGWIAIVGGRRQRTRSRPGNATPPRPMHGERTHRNEFVRLTLQRADFFRSQGNFLAEIETLMLATQRYDEPEFHYRVALSKVQFLNDVKGSLLAMGRAVELDPDNEKYRQTLTELERFDQE